MPLKFAFRVSKLGTSGRFQWPVGTWERSSSSRSTQAFQNTLEIVTRVETRLHHSPTPTKNGIWSAGAGCGRGPAGSHRVADGRHHGTHGGPGRRARRRRRRRRLRDAPRACACACCAPRVTFSLSRSREETLFFDFLNGGAHFSFGVVSFLRRTSQARRVKGFCVERHALSQFLRGGRAPGARGGGRRRRRRPTLKNPRSAA